MKYSTKTVIVVIRTVVTQNQELEYRYQSVVTVHFEFLGLWHFRCKDRIFFHSESIETLIEKMKTLVTKNIEFETGNEWFSLAFLEDSDYHNSKARIEIDIFTIKSSSTCVYLLIEASMKVKAIASENFRFGNRDKSLPNAPFGSFGLSKAWRRHKKHGILNKMSAGILLFFDCN